MAEKMYFELLYLEKESKSELMWPQINFYIYRGKKQWSLLGPTTK